MVVQGLGSRGCATPKHAHNCTSLRNAAVCGQVRAAVAHICDGSEGAQEPMPTPQHCDPVPGAGSHAGDRFSCSILP